MCNSKGFLLFNRKVTVGPTTLHTRRCPGAEGSLANSFTNIWKAIGINLVDGGKKHNDHGSQNKVLPFLLTAGIRNASTGRLTDSPFLGHNPTTHCFGRKEIGIKEQGKGRKKANEENSQTCAPGSTCKERMEFAQGRAELLVRLQRFP